MNDFDTSHLKGKSKQIADGIVKWMTDKYGQTPSGGGCRAFYSPQEWKDRGEDYGTTAALILVHDGGDLAPLCNWDYECYKQMEDFSKFLREEFGAHAEQCTSWYTAVYK